MAISPSQDSSATVRSSTPSCVGFLGQRGAPPPRSCNAIGFSAPQSRESSQELTMSCSSSLRAALGNTRFSVGQPPSLLVQNRGSATLVRSAAVTQHQGAVSSSGSTTPILGGSHGVTGLVRTGSVTVLPAEVYNGSSKGHLVRTAFRASASNLPATEAAKVVVGRGTPMTSREGSLPPSELAGNSLRGSGSTSIPESCPSSSRATLSSSRGPGSATPLRGNSITVPSSETGLSSLRGGATIASSDGVQHSRSSGSALPTLRSASMTVPTADAWKCLSRGSPTPLVLRRNGGATAEIHQESLRSNRSREQAGLIMPETLQATSPSRASGSAELPVKGSSRAARRVADQTAPSSRALQQIGAAVTQRSSEGSPQVVRQSSCTSNVSSSSNPAALLHRVVRSASPAPPLSVRPPAQWAYVQHTRQASPPKYTPQSRSPSPPGSLQPAQLPSPLRVTVSQPLTVMPQYTFCGGSGSMPVLLKTPVAATTSLLSATSTATSLAGCSGVVQVGKVLQPAAVRNTVCPTPQETDADDASQAKANSSDTDKEAEGSDLLKMLSSIEAIESQLTDGMLTGEIPPEQLARESSGGSYAPWVSGDHVGPKTAKMDIAEDSDGTPAQPDLKTYVSWLKTIRSETEVETKRFCEAFFNKGLEASYSPPDSMDEECRPYMRISAIREEDSTASGDTSGEAEQRHHSASSSSAPLEKPRSEVDLLSEVRDLKRALQHEVRQRRFDQTPPPNLDFASDECSFANSDEHEERKEAELRMQLAGAQQLHSQEARHRLAAIRAQLQGTKAEQELLRQCDEDWRCNVDRYREHCHDVRLSSEEASLEDPRSVDDMGLEPLRSFSRSWGSSSNGTSRPRNPSPPPRKQRIHAIEAV